MFYVIKIPKNGPATGFACEELDQSIYPQDKIDEGFFIIFKSEKEARKGYHDMLDHHPAKETIWGLLNINKVPGITAIKESVVKTNAEGGVEMIPLGVFHNPDAASYTGPPEENEYLVGGVPKTVYNIVTEVEGYKYGLMFIYELPKFIIEHRVDHELIRSRLRNGFNMTYDSLILEIHKALINNFTDNSPHLSAKGRSPAVREYITKIQKTAIPEPQPEQELTEAEVKANRDAADKYHDSKQELCDDEEGSDTVHHTNEAAFFNAKNGDLCFIVNEQENGIEGKSALVFSYTIPEFINAHEIELKTLRDEICKVISSSNDAVILEAHKALTLGLYEPEFTFSDESKLFIYALNISSIKAAIEHLTNNYPPDHCNHLEGLLKAHLGDSPLTIPAADDMIEIDAAPAHLNFNDRAENLTDLITDCLNISDSPRGDMELQYALTKAYVEAEYIRKLLS